MKRLLDSVFRRVEGGAFTVSYWDGTEHTYGEGPSAFRISLKEGRIARRLLRDPVLGIGEAYMDGLVDFEGDLDELFRMAHANTDVVNRRKGFLWRVFQRRPKPVSLRRQARDVQSHYDLGNEFFRLFLDESMTYSCAYFRTPETTLYEAQQAKVDHILRKLSLKPGQRLLDIGCGWGWLIQRAAEEYGVQAVGITLSREQHRGARERIERQGLSRRVEVRLVDFRELREEPFDRVVSVGMFEHVGSANYPLYMERVRSLLKPGGISLLHTITQPREGRLNPWLSKYIFPGGEIPSVRGITHLLPEYGLHLVDVESLRIHYAMTLDHWADRFEQHAEDVTRMYDERFTRMWRLYLRSCAASFRYSGLDIHQFLFTNGLNNELPLTREHVYRREVEESA